MSQEVQPKTEFPGPSQDECESSQSQPRRSNRRRKATLLKEEEKTEREAPNGKSPASYSPSNRKRKRNLV